MSSSESADRMTPLEKRLLVRVAERLGPGLDRVDPALGAAWSVREIVVEFTQQARKSPTAVRHALATLMEKGYLGWGFFGEGDEDLIGRNTEVTLRVAGLVAAREIKPGVGQPTTRICLEMTPKNGPLAARIVTGNRDRDREINRKGAVLCALYALVALIDSRGGTAELTELVEVGEALALEGIRARRGPPQRGERLGVSEESMAQALALLQSTMPGLARTAVEGDARRVQWFVAQGWPNVVVRDRSGGFRDWTAFVVRLRQVVEENREKLRLEAAKRGGEAVVPPATPESSRSRFAESGEPVA